MNPDQELFDSRPVVHDTCRHCHGTGSVVKSYVLSYYEDMFARPRSHIPTSVSGSFTIFEATTEASEIAKLAGRPVSFWFCDQLVSVAPVDDPIAVGRSWWRQAYGCTPEQSFADR